MKAIGWAVLLASALAASGCASSSADRPEAKTAAAPAKAETKQPESGEKKLECKGPPVQLGFGWPHHLTADVKSIEAIELDDSRQKKPMREALPTEHRLVTSTDDQGRLQMRFEDVGQGRPRLDGLLMEYGGAVPTLTLSPTSAEVLAIDGLDAMRAQSAKVAEENQLSDDEAKRVLTRIDGPTLLAESKAWWNLALSGWVGRRIGCGEVQKSEYDMPVETLGAKVPMKLEWRYLGSMPCSAKSGRGGEQCAELLVVGSADSDRTRELLQKQIQVMGGQKAQGIEVHKAELLRLVRLRVEPKTMLLHRVQAEEHIASTFSTPQGETVGRRQSDMQALAFQYGSAALDSAGESGESGESGGGKSQKAR